MNTNPVQTNSANRVAHRIFGVTGVKKTFLNYLDSTQV